MTAMNMSHDLGAPSREDEEWEELQEERRRRTFRR